MSASKFHTLHNSSDIACDDMWNPLTCSWLINDTAYLMVWEMASFFATLTSSLWWVFLASKIRNKHVALGKIVNFCISSESRLVRRQLQQWYCVTLLKRSWCCILLFLWKCKCGDHIFFLVLGTVLICGSSISVLYQVCSNRVFTVCDLWLSFSSMPYSGQSLTSVSARRSREELNTPWMALVSASYQDN